MNTRQEFDSLLRESHSPSLFRQTFATVISSVRFFEQWHEFDKHEILLGNFCFRTSEMCGIDGVFGSDTGAGSYRLPISLIGFRELQRRFSLWQGRNRIVMIAHVLVGPGTAIKDSRRRVVQNGLEIFLRKIPQGCDESLSVP
jgi:hypothetical protein